MRPSCHIHDTPDRLNGYTSLATWFRIGFVVSIVNIAIWSTIGFTWWKLLGLW